MEYCYLENKHRNKFKVKSKSASTGRLSPCHDLGYHTLLTRSTPVPTANHRGPYEWYPNTPSAPPVLRRQLAAPSTVKAKRQPKTSPFDKLSDTLITSVFSYLSSNNLCVCARVCRRWYFLAWEPQLWTTISLANDKIQVDRGLKTLFRLLCRDSPTGCITVEKICLNGCSKLTDRGLLTIANRCPELKIFQSRNCAEITNTGLAELVSRCSRLEKLDVTACLRVTAVQPLPSTRQSDVRSEAESTLSNGLYLQHLDLTDCLCLDDGGLKITVRCCPQLTYLYLRRCVQLTDAGIKYIASYCTAMKELSISDCVHVTDFGVYELAKLGPSLRYLSVAKCDQVSDAGVKQIARHCYKLRYLNVRGCEAVSDNSVEVLARSCTRLRALDLGKCDITDRGLKFLSEHCPNLKKLSLKSCELITDHGVHFVAYYCRGLQQLNIQDCPVTVEGYRKLRKLCRRCIIEHTNPGFC